MSKLHLYNVNVTWTGNAGEGTRTYNSYQRAHVIAAEGKTPIDGSSDPAFRGDPERWNPEELLVASLSACHKLWYLHLCSVNGIVVESYEDAAMGVMRETADGGHFERVVLRPSITLAPGGDVDRANALHQEASAKCFIRNSVNFPVEHTPDICVSVSSSS